MREEQEQQERTTDENNESQERKTMEKFWDATIGTWNTAAFRASQYKRIVQKKIDLTSLHKKISTAHADLGKAIDDLHQDGTVDIMDQAQVQNLLQSLTSMRSAAASLEEEIVTIKNEEPAEDELQPPEGGNA